MSAHTPGRLLVVDDNRVNRLLLVQGLEQEGHDVASAENGREALEMLRSRPFDLLLLDIWLSGWLGRDICIYLKSQEATKHFPIILVSANKDTENIAREAGADDFLTKPFELDELLAKLERYL